VDTLLFSVNGGEDLEICYKSRDSLSAALHNHAEVPAEWEWCGVGKRQRNAL